MTICVLALLWVCVAARAQAQSAGAGPTQVSGTPDPKPAWSFRASANAYVFPDDEDYVQPTVTADRGALHLEGRYNYEDRGSASGFLGWNIEIGSSVTLQLTPMFGILFGDSDGVVPALELDLAWSRLELYSEVEYVVDAEERENNFAYNWSEASFWVAEWLRAGAVTQRTRAYETPRDIQWGALAGVSLSNVEGTAYFFSPGSEDWFFVASIGISF